MMDNQPVFKKLNLVKIQLFKYIFLSFILRVRVTRSKFKKSGIVLIRNLTDKNLTIVNGKGERVFKNCRLVDSLTDFMNLKMLSLHSAVPRG